MSYSLSSNNPLRHFCHHNLYEYSWFFSKLLKKGYLFKENESKITVFAIASILWTNTLEVLACKFLRWTCFVLRITEFAFVTVGIKELIKFRSICSKIPAGIKFVIIFTFHRHNRYRDHTASPETKIYDFVKNLIIFFNLKKKPNRNYTHFVHTTAILARKHVFSARLRCGTMMKRYIFIGSVNTIWITVTYPGRDLQQIVNISFENECFSTSNLPFLWNTLWSSPGFVLITSEFRFFVTFAVVC